MSLVKRSPFKQQPIPFLKADLKHPTGLHQGSQASAVYPGCRGPEVRYLPAMTTISYRQQVNSSFHCYDA
jgi:hypothetical protein